MNDTCKYLQYIHLILLIIHVSNRLELPLSARVVKRCNSLEITRKADTWVKNIPSLLIMKECADF